MSEQSKTTSPDDKILKSIKDLKEELRFLRKVSVLNYYGSYDKDMETKLKDNFKNEKKVEKPVNNKLPVSALLVPASILLGSFLIGSFILLSRTAAADKYLEKYFGVKPAVTANNGTPNNAQPSADPQAPKIKDVSLDDDSVLGKKEAPVTIVEFSDFDCPWCKTFYDEIYPELKKEYIETGKVKLIYRDLPIKQLHPMAFEKSLAANCAKEQGGDEMYYKFHDQLFGRSPQPGQGQALDRAAVDKIAGDLGLNTGQFKTCMDTEKYKDEVQKDINNAVELEAYGTPTFFIGKSTDTGTFKGQMVEGAIPFAQMKIIIDTYLQ